MCRLENSCVEYFLPNSTAILQPLNMGIIGSVRVQYRSQLIKKVLLNLVSEGFEKINVKDACYDCFCVVVCKSVYH